MLLVEQGDGGCQTQLAIGHWQAVTHTVESIAIADEDTQRAFGSRGRNADWNLAHDALTTIGAEDGFDDDLVARACFSDIGARNFETRGTALADEVEVKF